MTTRYNPQSLSAWAGNDYQRWNMLSIARDSWGVYNFLRMNAAFPSAWAKGAEQSEVNSRKMLIALDDAAAKSGNPLAYANMVAKSISSDGMFTDNRIINRIEKVLRDNP